MTRINDLRPQYQPTPAAPKPKRRGLPRQSKKRAKLMREAGPEREAFVAAVGTCMACDMHAACHCHEIGRGNARERSLEHPELWMALCPSCHKAIHESNKESWTIERQIAVLLKWRLVRTLRLLNQVRGRALTAIQGDDIEPYWHWDFELRE